MRTRLPAAIAVVLAMSSGCRGNVNTTAGTPIPQPAVMAGQVSLALPCPPLFIMPPRLGFHVGVGVLYDIVFAYDNFYLYYGNTWYQAPNCKGPWTAAPYDALPPLIRKQSIESIRRNRDMEYRVYRRDQNHYRGRIFRPD